MADADVYLGAVKPGTITALNQSESRAVLADLKDMARQHEGIATLLAEPSALKDFVVAALSLSPYLRDMARLAPETLVRALTQPLRESLRATIADAGKVWRGSQGQATEAAVMAGLRMAKRDVAFMTALADLARVFDARETTYWLSEMAEAAVTASLNHLLLTAHNDGRIRLKNSDNPSEGSGLFALGMGKLGARELNYSSDIDLVVFFEPDAGVVEDPSEATDIFSRMMRRLIRILQERTEHGYVFRTDLRLRPDPGSTPLAIPVEAALLYYEGRGQNWERAAYIKARTIGGDRAAGDAFLKELTPFIFRKYLDYAAIADIHSIKRQIHAHKGHGTIAVKGHNVKLGRGGIREVEFFVQTQQLIAGGRLPALRLQPTEAMLRALAQANWIDWTTCDELIDAYWFLRDVEHRIQMVHDEQTHQLPETEAELKRIALMAGFTDTKAFAKALVLKLETVERRYAQLFEQESVLTSEAGNLVFTGQNDDPDTLETLAKLGFARPSDISRTIRTWHYGRYRATQSVEARERLTEMMPQLLQVFGASKRADDALLRFDQFLSGLPAGIQLFSLLGNNPSLLQLIVTIMSAAPRLAAIIATRPHVFDGMLDPGLLVELPTRDYLAGRIAMFVSGSTHYEETLDRLRIIASEQKFLIGIRLLTGAINGAQAGTAFTHLADLIIAAALKAVQQEIEAAYGRYPGGRVVVLGMGKLGSHELTAGSDVDLIILYDYDDTANQSDGEKPLDAVRYFTRLTQRLMAALSAPTAEGILYEVDMRLRPSGNKGPVATRIRAFEKYQHEDAWVWEHMALTRARVICGEDTLAREAQRILDAILGQDRDPAKVAGEAREMRLLIDKEKPPSGIWDLKLIAGGVVDIEFIAQVLSLTAPSVSKDLPSHQTRTADVLKSLGPQMMEPDDLHTVLAALATYTDIAQIMRLCIDGGFDPADAPVGLLDLVCRAADVPDIRMLEADIGRLSKAVRKIFLKTVQAR
jgi:[glutamine synthetase] adenylyltransferase / [glutamine synthetase]-adenylyl-L-tyrosine phosphorylase